MVKAVALPPPARGAPAGGVRIDTEPALTAARATDVPNTETPTAARATITTARRPTRRRSIFTRFDTGSPRVSVLQYRPRKTATEEWNCGGARMVSRCRQDEQSERSDVADRIDGRQGADHLVPVITLIGRHPPEPRRPSTRVRKWSAPDQTRACVARTGRPLACPTEFRSVAPGFAPRFGPSPAGWGWRETPEAQRAAVRWHELGT